MNPRAKKTIKIEIMKLKKKTSIEKLKPVWKNVVSHFGKYAFLLSYRVIAD